MWGRQFNHSQKIAEVKTKQTDTWMFYYIDAPKSLFKLHLDMGIETYHQYIGSVIMDLINAVKEGVIYKFKYLRFLNTNEMYNWSNKRYQKLLKLQALKGYLDRHEQLPLKGIQFYQKYFKKPFDINNVALNQEMNDSINKEHKRVAKRLRLSHHPVTIYLPETIDYEKLTALCLILESKLKNISSHSKYLSESDVSLLPHVSFRQGKIRVKNANGEVEDQRISPYADSDQVKQLRISALQSEVYTTLKTMIEKQQAVTDANRATNKPF